LQQWRSVIFFVLHVTGVLLGLSFCNDYNFQSLFFRGLSFSGLASTTPLIQVFNIYVILLTHRQTLAKKHNLLGGGKISSETRPPVTIRHSALSMPRLLLGCLWSWEHQITTSWDNFTFFKTATPNYSENAKRFTSAS